jgi:hypothetical protein
MKISLSGSSSIWPSNQACRRARTSGRCGSEDGRSFFACQPAPGEEVPDRRRAGAHAALARPFLGDLVERDILVRVDKAEDETLVRIELRSRRLTLPSGRHRALLPPLPMPFDRGRRRHREPRCRRPRRQAVIDRLHHPLTQVQTVASPHICLPNQLGIQNQVCRAEGIPFNDSDKLEPALDRAKGHGGLLTKHARRQRQAFVLQRDGVRRDGVDRRGRPPE